MLRQRRSICVPIVSEDLACATLEEASALLRRGDVSPTDVLDSVLERSSRLDPKLNAFVTIVEDRARRRAKELEQQPRAVRARQPLWGVPVSVKDNIAVAGAPTTAGSCVPVMNPDRSSCKLRAPYYPCPRGGTGRRSRLKICRSQGRVRSIRTMGTTRVKR